MIKNLIAPLQQILLQKKACPACTRNLAKAKTLGEIEAGVVVACKCGRVFITNDNKTVFRRALNEEIQNLVTVR